MGKYIVNGMFNIEECILYFLSSQLNAFYQISLTFFENRKFML